MNNTLCHCGKFSLPLIQPVFDSKQSHFYNVFSQDVIHHVLHEILFKVVKMPGMEKGCSDHLQGVSDIRSVLRSRLPLITSCAPSELPGEMSFFSLAKLRINAFKFFFEIISNWLVPGRRLNVSMLYAVDFRMPEVSDEIYTLCEIKLQIESQAEMDQILRNLPILETELCLGMESGRYARRILEIKGLSTDEKTALIQEDLAYLVSRLPKEFDFDVLAEMQHVLLICQEEFKTARSCRHLSRIISLHYFFRKLLQEAVKAAPQRRHLHLKLFRARIPSHMGSKKVLGIVVGMNFFRDKELFDRAHLLKAIQNYIPGIQDVEGSFFANRRGSELIGTLYIEVEKNNKEDFSIDEIQRLRKKLSRDLKDRVEHVMHPVFMPRNEEEIFRNILSLSSQIKYVRDIPQVFISFDEQTYKHLFYTIIVVRVLKPEALSIQEMFKKNATHLKYIPDRCQLTGLLRKKYKKEATVFRVKFSKDQFLRFDHSIDLNKARQTVVAQLEQIIGEFRDFNGGMISKQNELLSEVKDLLHSANYNDHFLDNFFYSLTPVIMRTVLEPESVKTLFLMLLESIEQVHLGGEVTLKISQHHHVVFAMIRTDDPLFRDEISRALTRHSVHSSELTTSFVSVHDVFYLGYIYRADEKEKQSAFCQLLRSCTLAPQPALR